MNRGLDSFAVYQQIFISLVSSIPHKYSWIYSRQSLHFPYFVLYSLQGP